MLVASEELAARIERAEAAMAAAAAGRAAGRLPAGAAFVEPLGGEPAGGASMELLYARAVLVRPPPHGKPAG